MSEPVLKKAAYFDRVYADYCVQAEILAERALARKERAELKTLTAQLEVLTSEHEVLLQKMALLEKEGKR